MLRLTARLSGLLLILVALGLAGAMALGQQDAAAMIWSLRDATRESPPMLQFYDPRWGGVVHLPLSTQMVTLGVWSRDGAQIAYYGFDGRGYTLWTFAPQSGTETQLRSALRSASPLTWSPDGARLAYLSDADRSQPRRICVIDLRVPESEDCFAPFNVWTMQWLHGADGVHGAGGTNDGTIYYEVDTGVGRVPYVLDLASGRTLALDISLMALDYDKGVRWSGDGQYSVYVEPDASFQDKQFVVSAWPPFDFSADGPLTPRQSWTIVPPPLRASSWLTAHLSDRQPYLIAAQLTAQDGGLLHLIDLRDGHTLGQIASPVDTRSDLDYVTWEADAFTLYTYVTQADGARVLTIQRYRIDLNADPPMTQLSVQQMPLPLLDRGNHWRP